MVERAVGDIAQFRSHAGLDPVSINVRFRPIADMSYSTRLQVD